MEFPFGKHHHHHHHHHHHERKDDEEERREYYPPPDTLPPPPSLYHQPPPYHTHHEFAPRPPPPPSGPFQETHVYHTSHHQELDSSPDYYPSRPPTQVTHVSHESSETRHSYSPHLPSFIQHHTHHSDSPSGLDLSNKPTYKVYCKAEPNFYLSIRDGKVVLASSDPTDEFQKWYKDEKYSTRVKDEEGCPCFALVNKATGQAMKHSVGATHPVQLIPYNPDKLDESVLWTESKDFGDGYRAVRMVNNVHLNVDAFHGDKKSGGIHDGTIIVLWKWNKGDNQQWRITRHCKFLGQHAARNSSSYDVLTTLSLIF